MREWDLCLTSFKKNTLLHTSYKVFYWISLLFVFLFTSCGSGEGWNFFVLFPPPTACCYREISHFKLMSWCSILSAHGTFLELGFGDFSFCFPLPYNLLLSEIGIMQNILTVLFKLLALETPFPSASPSQVICAAEPGLGKGQDGKGWEGRRKRKSFTPPFQPEAGAWSGHSNGRRSCLKKGGGVGGGRGGQGKKK